MCCDMEPAARKDPCCGILQFAVNDVICAHVNILWGNGLLFRYKVLTVSSTGVR
jgi:hypothetical protein